MPDLTSTYQKWDSLVDSDDESGVGRDGISNMMDLDAVAGPKEEVEMIKKAWGLEKEKEKEKEKVDRKIDSSLNTQPPNLTVKNKQVVSSGKPRDFVDWDKFDADKMLLEMENEDLHDPEEAPSMVTASEKLVNVDCVDYKKDREEYELDKELAQRGADLKQRTSYRFNTAHSLKQEANSLLKASPSKAIRTYISASSCLEPCLSATPLMAPSLAVKINDLYTTLHANLSQAYITTNDYQKGAASASAALGIIPGHEKALYRRAVCRMHLGEYKAALEDISGLKGNSAAEKLKLQIEEKLMV